MEEELIQPDAIATEMTKPARKKGKAPEELVEQAEVETSDEPAINSVQFSQLSPSPRTGERSALDLILDVHLQATVELGRSQIAVRDILNLGPGSVVELDKLAGEPADLLVNGKPLARGEVVVIDENFGIRITEIIAPTERINSLR